MNSTTYLWTSDILLRNTPSSFSDGNPIATILGLMTIEEREGGREGEREGSKELRSYKLYVLWKTEDLWDTKYGIERERWQIQSANGTYDKQKHLKQTYQTLGDTSLYTHLAIIWNNNFTHSLSLSLLHCVSLSYNPIHTHTQTHMYIHTHTFSLSRFCFISHAEANKLHYYNVYHSNVLLLQYMCYIS